MPERQNALTTDTTFCLATVALVTPKTKKLSLYFIIYLVYVVYDELDDDITFFSLRCDQHCRSKAKSGIGS